MSLSERGRTVLPMKSLGNISSLSKYSRGSEWRRWDLHVHTLYSALNNSFGNDFKLYAKTLFERAVKDEIAVIGVTDYFTIKGYRQLRDLQRDDDQLVALLGEQAAETARQILLLPNIELRLRDVVRVDEKDARINLHVILAEDLDPDEIEEQFLHRLEFTAESSPDEPDDRKALTEGNLTDLGNRLKEQHSSFQGSGGLQVGMTQAVVSHEQVTRLLAKTRRFDKRYLLVAAADEDLSEISWDSQAHLTRKLIIQKSHMLFSANPGTREFGLGLRHPSRDALIEEFKSIKPCIHGSDAHSFEELFVCAKDRQLWIRANPGFDGLVQLLHAPDDRVYLGPEPPALERIKRAATKSIKSVDFKRVGEPGDDAQWFSGSIPLNPGLVAVIGRKGGGKSALTDAIALASNAHNREEFSFLNEERFLNPRRKLGQYFTVDLLWRSGESEGKRLDDETDPNLPERVRHIPQHYLETICAEIQDASARTLFDSELEAVIFSHVPKADRLGCDNLQDLVEHRTAEKEARIRQLRGKLSDLNREYVALRQRASVQNQKNVAAQLEQKRAELVAHDNAKPSEVPAPGAGSGLSPEAQRVADELRKIVAEIEQLDTKLVELRKQEELAKRKQVAVERILSRIENLQQDVDRFHDQSAAEAELLGVDPKKLVVVKADAAELREMRGTLEREIELVTLALSERHAGSSARLRVEASSKADQLRHQLGEPERRYQEYQRALSHWHKQRTQLQGSANDSESLVGLEAKLEALKDVPDQLDAKRIERSALMQKIFDLKDELLGEYRELYVPVQKFIDDHGVAQEVNDLSFSASIAVDGLLDGLLAMVHQGKRGSFQGDQEGRERLRGLIRQHDFSNAAGVAAFVEELAEHLSRDVRQSNQPRVDLNSQLVQGANAEKLYDFIFGLEYLRPRFELLWRGKPLNNLSPGERGTLLLIFYLLIDRDDVPLLIDQPEENLDNETVAELLVPAIKHAKERRQIIMVTHNPNLAVVCDADQVVHATIDKTDGNRITYASGAIEDPWINKLIVDVLEGTKPAFDIRDAKYEVLDRVAAA